MKRETIIETVRRGRKRGSKIIVLSYCQQWIAEEEWREIMDPTVCDCVYFLDANDAVQGRYAARLYNLGKGIYCNKMSWPEEIPNADYDSWDRILFSENLLQQGYIVSSWNPALTYAYSMNPWLSLKYEGEKGRHWLLPERGLPTVYFCLTAREALEKVRSGKQAYCYPLGGMFDGFTYVNVKEPVPRVLATRRVYYSELQEGMASVLATSKERHGDGYFFWSLQARSISVSFYDYEAHTKTNVTVEFRDMEQDLKKRVKTVIDINPTGMLTVVEDNV
jgi:hypothetical protein